MILTLAVRASLRGWMRLSSFLIELDCALAGLGGASRRIRRKQEKRRKLPPARFVIAGPGL